VLLDHADASAHHLRELEHGDACGERVRREGGAQVVDHLIADGGDRVEELLRAAGLGVRRSPDRYNRSIGYVHARRL
jgi:hypothetical protein